MTLGSLGRYELIERIGAGGMAEVFRARRRDAAGIEGTVAIKRILPLFTDDAAFVEMFVSEARIAMSLSHGNIVTTHEFGEADGTYFLAMEHVDGTDLDKVLAACRRQGRLIPTSLAVFIAAEVLAGLDYAHHKRGPDGPPLRLVHRDISPSNVLVSREGAVKLTDFGIAKATARAHALSAVGIVKGKIAYMSPEQAAGGPLDHRSDVFSLGLVLHEMLIGQRPYHAREAHRLLAQAVDAKVADVSIHTDVSPELGSIVMRALARDPAQRFASAGEMRRELLGYLYATETHAPSPADVAAFVDQVSEAVGRSVALDGQIRELLPLVDADMPATLMAGQAREPTAPTMAAVLAATGEPASVTDERESSGTTSVSTSSTRSWVLLAGAAATVAVLGTWWWTQSQAVTTGVIAVRSVPAGATIRLDGRVLSDRTPAILEEIDALEPHRIELHLVGYQQWSQRVVLRGTRWPRAEVLAELAPLLEEVAASDAGPLDPAVASDGGLTTDVGNDVVGVLAQPGLLNLGASPWAYVTIRRGRRVVVENRSTPIHQLSLPPGRYLAEASNPVLGLTGSAEFAIESAETTVVRMNLR